MGIPPEVKEKMFNPFFTTKPAGEGTGLGLSISHDIIVKQHGGWIEIDTEPGEFTEVRLFCHEQGLSSPDKSQMHVRFWPIADIWFALHMSGFEGEAGPDVARPLKILNGIDCFFAHTMITDTSQAIIVT